MVALNKVPVQTEHTIEIKKIITGGSGLGHLENGMVAMTPFVLPGEQVTIAEVKRFSGHIQAKALQIKQPSPKRQPPFCSQYTICGGCALQHTTYQNQLAIKKEILAETLSRGHVEPKNNIPLPVPSPKDKGYRYRIRLHLAENGAIGFYKIQSHEIVTIEHCPLAAPALNSILLHLHKSDLLSELARFCRQIELLCSPADNTVVATLHLLSAEKPSQPLQKKILSETGLDGLACTFQKKTTFFPQPIRLQQQFSINNQSYRLEWDSRCFFQVNPEQNGQLVQMVSAGAGFVAGKTILDLFCGMGNFSIPLATAGAEVTGIESNKHSIKTARKNAQNAGIQTSNFLTGNVGRQLAQLCKKGIRFDIVLLDPPRQGLGRATRLLPQLQAEKVLYISCDPATLTRDLQILVQKGYTLKSVTPIDMFPQTHHIECLAILEKN